MILLHEIPMFFFSLRLGTTAATTAASTSAGKIIYIIFLAFSVVDNLHVLYSLRALSVRVEKCVFVSCAR